MDLEFAQKCLELVEAAPRDAWHTPPTEAAWRSALLHYCKCFAPPQGGFGRSQLSATKILGREDKQPMKDHRRMMDLRNKHLVHDDNSHNWVAVGALVAPAGSAQSIFNVSVAAMDSVSLDDDSAKQLRELVDRVLDWTAREFSQLAGDIGAMLQQTHTHADLLSQKALGVVYKSKPPKARPR